MSQDFTKKFSIILRDDLASWQLTNTVGHIAAYLGNKMTEPFDTGEFFMSKDMTKLPRNSQFPVIALKATKDQLKSVSARAREAGLLSITYTQDMIETTDDSELEKMLSNQNFDEVDILGVGVFGPNDTLKSLTSGLKLWK